MCFGRGEAYVIKSAYAAENAALSFIFHLSPFAETEVCRVYVRKFSVRVIGSVRRDLKEKRAAEAVVIIKSSAEALRVKADRAAEGELSVTELKALSRDRIGGADKGVGTRGKERIVDVGELLGCMIGRQTLGL